MLETNFCESLGVQPEAPPRSPTPPPRARPLAPMTATERNTYGLADDALPTAPAPEAGNAPATTSPIPTTTTTATPTPVRPLNEFAVDADTNGHNLLGNRFLCRGGGLLLAAPTGIGKSSFSLQAAITWALGQPHFGIAPSGKLRSLFIQAENDPGDLAEMRDGVFRGLDLSDPDRATACGSIHVACESSATGAGFVTLVAELVGKHKPDLLWIDPLFAYLGNDVCDQAAVSMFLRNGMNPILQANGCALVLIHHTNKPKSGREKPDWQAGDFAYLGSGTSELANWSRAVIGIRSIGSHTVFEAVLGKRGRRAGLCDEDGEPAYSFFMQHGKTGICWRPATAKDAEPVEKVRPGKEALRDLIPSDGAIGQAKLFNSASEIHIGEKRCRALLAELIEEGRTHEWRTPRTGTNNAKSYSLNPQKREQI